MKRSFVKSSNDNNLQIDGEKTLVEMSFFRKMIEKQKQKGEKIRE